MKLDKKSEEALKAISPEKRSDILNSIGKQLAGKDLTQRQASATPESIEKGYMFHNSIDISKYGSTFKTEFDALTTEGKHSLSMSF